MTQQIGRVQNGPIQVQPKASSAAALINSSIKPGNGVYLAFNEGVMNLYYDRLGDWTISVALSTNSILAGGIVGGLEKMGYFQAAEKDGRIYYIWTSALHCTEDKRRNAEDTLLGTLKVLENAVHPQYIS
jgi:hypothetical protein